MRRRGFTLIELLIVIGIIAVLIGILVPTLMGVRQSAQNVACRSNLREVGNAMRMYANDNRDRFPDGYTTGGAVYRMAPGHKNSSDPFSRGEVYGMPALLHGIDYGTDVSKGLPRLVKYLPGDSKLWICPAMPDWMREYGNTYFWSQGDMMNWTSVQRGKYNNTDEKATGPGRSAPPIVMQDNVSFLPYTPVGFRRTTGIQPAISPTSNYIYPHPFRTRRTRTGTSQRIAGAANVLFITGQVGTNVYTYVGGSLDVETIQ